MSHPFGQVRVTGFDRGDDNDSTSSSKLAAPAKPRNNLTQDIQESCAILIVVKDRFVAIASGSHMIKCARILDAKRPGHDVVLQQTEY